MKPPYSVTKRNKRKELLKKLQEKTKELDNIKWDFFGFKWRKNQREWNEIEHKLYAECFGA